MRKWISILGFTVALATFLVGFNTPSYANDVWATSYNLDATTKAYAILSLSYPDARCAVRTQAHWLAETQNSTTGALKNINKIGFNWEYWTNITNTGDSGASFYTPGSYITHDSPIVSPIDWASADFIFEIPASQWYPSPTVNHCRSGNKNAAEDSLVKNTPDNRESAVTLAKDILNKERASVLSKYTIDGVPVTPEQLSVTKATLFEGQKTINVEKLTFEKDSPSYAWVVQFSLPYKVEYNGSKYKLEASVLLDRESNDYISSISTEIVQ